MLSKLSTTPTYLRMPPRQDDANQDQQEQNGEGDDPNEMLDNNATLEEWKEVGF
jgi:hypothetical protein